MFLHGIKVNELTIGARAITGIATQVIGLVVTASHSDGAAEDAKVQAAFPLDTPVLVTDVRAAIRVAGDSGTLAPSLAAIADQCNPYLVVVRVAEGADDAATETNVLGDAGTRTGIHAFTTAQAVTGLRPRILAVPGLDSAAVVAALAPIAEQLRAMVYFQLTAATVADAVTAVDDYGQRELMPIWPRFENTFLGDTVARAVGLRARLDQQVGWHKTLSNVLVQGVTAIETPVSFDMLGGDTDAKLLNDAGITTLIRDEGFRFWGNRTQSSEPLFAFESATRTAQVLQDEMAEGLKWAIDKPMTKQLVKDIVATIRRRFDRLVADDRLIGASVWYDPAQNTEGELANGQLVLDYDFTPVAPLEGLTLNQRITDRFYADFANLVVG